MNDEDWFRKRFRTRPRGCSELLRFGALVGGLALSALGYGLFLIG